jgi:hypothetical protein
MIAMIPKNDGVSLVVEGQTISGIDIRFIDS